MNFRYRNLLLAVFLMAWSGCNLGPPTGGGTGVEGISGQLVDPSGEPVEGAWVKAYQTPTLAKSQGPDRDGAGGALPISDSVRTNAKGHFNIPGLEHGTYTIVATSGNREPDSILALILRGITVTGDTNIGVDTLRPAGSVSLTIQDSNGPVLGAYCVAVGTPFESFTDADGQCVLENLPPGEFEIVVTLGGAVVGTWGDLNIFSGIMSEMGVLDVATGDQTLPAPALLSPVNGASVKPLDSLIWGPSDGASAYHLEIVLASDFLFEDPFVSDSTLTTLSYPVSLKSVGIPYRWRVRARNATGAGSWSTSRTFITALSSRPPMHFRREPTTVALWLFDSIHGINGFWDAGGRGHHLPAPTSAVLSASPTGKSVAYNGGKSTLTNANLLTLSGSPILTYEVRLKLDSYPSSSQWNGAATVIGQSAGLKMMISQDGRIQAATQSGDGLTWNEYTPITAASTVPRYQWVDIAVAAVRDSGLVYIYVNGVPVQPYIDVKGGAVLRPSTTAEFNFAVGSDALDPQPFMGIIDEIRVSNSLILGPGLAPIVGPIPGK